VLVDSLLDTAGTQRDLWNQYMFIASLMHRAAMIVATNKMLAGHANLKVGLKPWIVYLEDVLHIDKNTLCNMRQSREPLIVQTDPLSFDVVHRGVRFRCGYDIRRAIMTWFFLVDERLDGVVKHKNSAYNLRRLIRDVLYPSLAVAPSEDGSAQRKQQEQQVRQKVDKLVDSLFKLGSTQALAEDRRQRKEQYERSNQGTTKVLINRSISGTSYDFHGIKRRRMEAQAAAGGLKKDDLFAEAAAGADDENETDEQRQEKEVEKLKKGRVTKLDESNNGGDGDEEGAEQDDPDAYGEDDYRVDVERLMETNRFKGSMAERIARVFGDTNRHLNYSGDVGSGSAAGAMEKAVDAAEASDAGSSGSVAERYAQAYAARSHYGVQNAPNWNPTLAAAANRQRWQQQ
jgi:hypothetical protein